MTAPMRVDGVDISHWQSGTLNMAAAKKAGVKWMYHKATEGNSYKDPNYGKRRAEAKAAGIPFGAYHFARASAKTTDAVAEAKHFLATATPKPGDMRPMLDLETTEGLSLTALRAWAKAFIAEVKRQTKVLPIVYTPYDLGAADDGCLIWRARYNDDNRPPVLKWDIWQFSNGQYGVPDKVAGFGAVDLNTMRAGLKLADMQIPTAPKPPVKPPKKTAKLRFAHCSLQFSDTTPEMKHDVELLFSRGYDVVTGTEAGHGSGDLQGLLETGAEKHGYYFSKTTRYDTWVLVKKSLVSGDFKMGAEFALWRSSKTPGAVGRWGDKGVVWATWDMGPTYGKFAFAAVHYLTWRGTGTKELKNSTDLKYAKAIAKWALAQPDEVSVFVGGDFNRKDKGDDWFRGVAPFASCWDDLKVWPNTGHGNIDGIARHKADARVRCTGARVLDDGDLFLNTDHFLVEADYEVRAI